MTADESSPTPEPTRRRRITATACLALSIVMLLATPAFVQTTRHDRGIRIAQLLEADQHRRLLDSGASPEALDLHRHTAQTHLSKLKVRRRIGFYARAATHFGLTLGLFLIWRSLRQSVDSLPPAGISTST